MSQSIITILITFAIMAWTTSLAKKKGTHFQVLENGDKITGWFTTLKGLLLTMHGEKRLPLNGKI